VSLADRYQVTGVPGGPWLAWQPENTYVWLTNEEKFATVRMTYHLAASNMGKIGLTMCDGDGNRSHEEIWHTDARGCGINGHRIILPTNHCLLAPQYVVDEWRAGCWNRYGQLYTSVDIVMQVIGGSMNTTGRPNSVYRVLEHGTNHVIAILGRNNELPHISTRVPASLNVCYVSGVEGRMSSFRTSATNPSPDRNFIPAAPQVRQLTAPTQRQQRAVRITPESRERRREPATEPEPLPTETIPGFETIGQAISMEDIREALINGPPPYAMSRPAPDTPRGITVQPMYEVGSPEPTAYTLSDRRTFMRNQDYWVIAGHEADPMVGTLLGIENGSRHALASVRFATPNPRGPGPYSVPVTNLFRTIEEARAAIALRQVPAINQLTDGGVGQAATAALNEFTRQQLRRDGFTRRILPPVQVSNDELDRSVATDIPVRVVDEEAYQALFDNYLNSPGETVSMSFDEMRRRDLHGMLNADIANYTVYYDDEGTMRQGNVTTWEREEGTVGVNTMLEGDLQHYYRGIEDLWGSVSAYERDHPGGAAILDNRRVLLADFDQPTPINMADLTTEEVTAEPSLHEILGYQGLRFLARLRSGDQDVRGTPPVFVWGRDYPIPFQTHLTAYRPVSHQAVVEFDGLQHIVQLNEVWGSMDLIQLHWENNRESLGTRPPHEPRPMAEVVAAAQEARAATETDPGTNYTSQQTLVEIGERHGLTTASINRPVWAIFRENGDGPIQYITGILHAFDTHTGEVTLEQNGNMIQTPLQNVWGTAEALEAWLLNTRTVRRTDWTLAYANLLNAMQAAETERTQERNILFASAYGRRPDQPDRNGDVMTEDAMLEAWRQFNEQQMAANMEHGEAGPAIGNITGLERLAIEPDEETRREILRNGWQEEVELPDIVQQETQTNYESADSMPTPDGEAGWLALAQERELLHIGERVWAVVRGVGSAPIRFHGELVEVSLARGRAVVRRSQTVVQRISLYYLWGSETALQAFLDQGTQLDDVELRAYDRTLAEMRRYSGDSESTDENAEFWDEAERVLLPDPDPDTEDHSEVRGTPDPEDYYDPPF